MPWTTAELAAIGERLAATLPPGRAKHTLTSSHHAAT